jgi:hypothetical protein
MIMKSGLPAFHPTVKNGPKQGLTATVPPIASGIKTIDGTLCILILQTSCQVVCII